MQSAESREDSHRRLAELQEAKQRCARRFGEAKRERTDLEPLKAEMRAITEAIEALRASLGCSQPGEQPCADSTAENARSELPTRFGAVSTGIAAVNGSISVRVALDSDSAGWDEYVAGHPDASPYHLSSCRRLIEKAMRHEDASVVALNEYGKIVGLLPLIYMHTRLFGRIVVSMPYFNYGGPLADSEAIEAALMNEAAATGARLNAKYVEVRELRERQGFPARDDKVSMLRHLPATTQQLDLELGSKVRAQVKRALREAPDVAFGQFDLLDEFYEVFAENMRDLGTPVYSKEFFRQVLQAWPTSARVIVLRLKRIPVAAAMLIGHRDVLEIPWASALRRTNPMSLNMLLYREALGFAIREKYRWFDFGRSTEGASTFRFKKQWGSVPARHHWHYWLAPGQAVPQLNPDNRKFRILISLWRRIPVPVTKLMGPSIVRGIP